MKIDKWTSGAHYDQWMGRWSRLLAQGFLKWLDLPAGLHWIDVCCGSGMVTEAIIERSKPASVVGVDASAAQIRFACEHRADSRVTFQIADATALPFADSSFDVAVCGLGLNYVPNAGRALEEFRRVIRAGGSVGAYVWDYAHGVRFVREFWDAAIAIDSEAASFDQALRFPMCSQEGLRSLFEQAKIEEIAVRALDVVTRFIDFEDYWEPLLTGQGSAPNYLAARDEQIRAAIRERLRATLPRNNEGAIELPARAWAIRGRKKL
ncbi:MAG: methyltransferase domain-containing protein [Candidatus Acidiferrales bacterium]